MNFNPPAGQNLLQDLDGNKSFQSNIELQDGRINFHDHCVQSICVVPGAFFVDVAMCAAQSVGKAICAVKEIRFEQVFVLANDSQPTGNISLVVTDDDGGPFVECMSLAGSDWTRNASMRIAYGDEAIGVANQPTWNAPNTANWQRHDKASIYRRLKQNGNQYGPSFQGIDSVEINSDQCLATVALPEQHGDSLAGPGIPPVMLDACAQTLAAIGIEFGKTFVLEGIDELRVFGPYQTRFRIWARVQKQELGESNTGIGDVEIFDESGACLASLTGVRFRYLENGNSESDRNREANDTMAISATFTAEPLEETLAFWANQIGLDIAPKFAPFNQVFQELLDPQSLLAGNDSGVNVTALRLEDWSQSISENDHSQQQQPVASEPEQTYRLPNQLAISHINQYETEYLFKEIFVDRCYVRHGISLEGAKCVIDIGANIGMFTMFVQQQCPDAKVYSFEPGPKVFGALKANSILLNENAKAFNFGVSDSTGEAVFTYYDKSTVFSTFSADEADDQAAIRAVIENMVHDGVESDAPAESKGDVDQIVDELLDQRTESKTITCPLVTISDIIRDNEIERIDLLKVDAEKSELPILNGIDDADWPKIQQIVIEVHDKVGDVIETVVDLLKKRGFIFEITEEELLRNSGLYNIYATREPVGTTSTRRMAEPMILSRRDRELIEHAADDFVEAAKSFSARSSLPHIVTFGAPSVRLVENQPDVDYLAKIEANLTNRLSELDGVIVLPSKNVATQYPVEDYFDAIGDDAGRVPYTPAYYSALATALIRRYQVATRQPYKVIVLDCDNTLWKGVCGEEGPNGIELDEPRIALQSFVKQQIDKGMIVCLCSKNVEEDVFAVFDARHDMPLQRDDIVANRINWQPKSLNLISLAKELNLGLDSFIMIDDSPVECAEIRANCPEVLTLQLPVHESETIPRFLDHVWAFDQPGSTNEDKKRTRLYQENTKRESLRADSMTLKDFLAKLNLKIKIGPMESGHLERVADLTRRTNQFNVSTIRRSTGEIKALLDDGVDSVVVHVSDRFGDYGLVGLLLVATLNDALVVDTMLLSCRVLGRGVEHEMLAWAGKLAQTKGLSRVDITYQTTNKNVPARQFLDAVGTRYRETIDENTAVYRIPSEELLDLSFEPQDVLDQAQPAEQSQTPAVSPDTRQTAKKPNALSARIATELFDAQRIMELSQSSGRPQQRPDITTIYLAPKTELEKDIANVWANVLTLDKVGIRDNFFDLGGTSLKAVQLITELNRQLEIQIPIVNLFADPTVEALARQLDEPAAESDKTKSNLRRGTARRDAQKRRRRAR